MGLLQPALLLLDLATCCRPFALRKGTLPGQALRIPLGLSIGSTCPQCWAVRDTWLQLVQGCGHACGLQLCALLGAACNVSMELPLLLSQAVVTSPAAGSWGLSTAQCLARPFHPFWVGRQSRPPHGVLI